MSLIPPSASVSSRFWVRLWAVLMFFSLFAAQFTRNLLGYWGFAVVALLIFVSSALVLLIHKPRWRWRQVSKSTIAFLLFATLSLAWSFYPGGTALGVTTQIMTTVVGIALALVLSWAEFVRTFSVALRWILGLSLAFELWVALFVGHPLLPNFMTVTGTVPKAFYWSRDLLLAGGPIEGIVANRNLLGFIALLAAIVFATQLAAQSVRRGWGVFWLVIAAATLALTRSSTVIAAAFVVLLGLAFALAMRKRGPERRSPVYLIAILSVAAAVVIAWLLRAPLLALLGKSEDLTGRFDIWATVGGMFAERPVAGWGWIGYWQPWVEPFNDLIVIKGVTYLQAHNAWLDTAMQLGVIGVFVLAIVVWSTTYRSWLIAIDRPRFGLDAALPFGATSLLPLLLMLALITQSFAESRLLVEGNWALLVALAFVTKRQFWQPEVMA